MTQLLLLLFDDIPVIALPFHLSFQQYLKSILSFHDMIAIVLLKNSF